MGRWAGDSVTTRFVLGALWHWMNGCQVCRVRENIGAMHQKDLCEAECSQDHSFHFVRLAVSSERGPVSKQVQRRSKLLDLKVDLAERQVLLMGTDAAKVVLSACLISLQLPWLICSAGCH